MASGFHHLNLSSPFLTVTVLPKQGLKAALYLHPVLWEAGARDHLRGENGLLIAVSCP